MSDLSITRSNAASPSMTARSSRPSGNVAGPARSQDAYAGSVELPGAGLMPRPASFGRVSLPDTTPREMPLSAQTDAELEARVCRDEATLKSNWKATAALMGGPESAQQALVNMGESDTMNTWIDETAAADPAWAHDAEGAAKKNYKNLTPAEAHAYNRFEGEAQTQTVRMWGIGLVGGHYQRTPQQLATRDAVGDNFTRMNQASADLTQISQERARRAGFATTH